MAKKGSTKSTTETKVDNPVVVLENKLQDDLSTNVTNEVSDIVEKLEDLKPTDEIIEQVMSSESEEVEKTINSELEKIDSLKSAVEDKIQEIINEHPEVTNVAKKISNARFTNFWNGIEY